MLACEEFGDTPVPPAPKKQKLTREEMCQVNAMAPVSSTCSPVSGMCPRKLAATCWPVSGLRHGICDIAYTLACEEALAHMFGEPAPKPKMSAKEAAKQEKQPKISAELEHEIRSLKDSSLTVIERGIYIEHTSEPQLVCEAPEGMLWSESHVGEWMALYLRTSKTTEICNS